MSRPRQLLCILAVLGMFVLAILLIQPTAQPSLAQTNAKDMAELYQKMLQATQNGNKTPVGFSFRTSGTYVEGYVTSIGDNHMCVRDDRFNMHRMHCFLLSEVLTFHTENLDLEAK